MTARTREALPALLVFGLMLVAASCNLRPGSDVAPPSGAIEPTGSVGGQAGETIVLDSGPVPADRLMPEHFDYQGAFRLPDEFAWGAMGLAYYPSGNGGAGSLFVTGFQGLLDASLEPCYEGSRGCNAYFAEIFLPTPTQTVNWEDLPMADFLQPMTVFDGGLVQTVHEAYTFVSGIAYVPAQGSQTATSSTGL